MTEHGTRAVAVALALCAAMTPARAPPTGSAAPSTASVPISDIVRRTVTEGCAPLAINAAIDAVAFGNLASWLEAQGRAIEAQRVRAMMRLETELFGSMHETVEQIIATQVFTYGRGGRWDADRN
ncbi:hypothetical protein, partial [Escherichia coli]|uniref:hypothetical protein n=1 Tax=Escherichia coli TaxID=562 RepID=UPI00197EDB13